MHWNGVSKAYAFEWSNKTAVIEQKKACKRTLQSHLPPLCAGPHGQENVRIAMALYRIVRLRLRGVNMLQFDIIVVFLTTKYPSLTEVILTICMAHAFIKLSKSFYI